MTYQHPITPPPDMGREIWLIGRAARRPKPPSLKEQALEEVRAWQGMGTCNINIIIRALEALPDD